MHNVPISPYLKSHTIAVKHCNEEGELHIYFYKNAVMGEDWFIQEHIKNR